MIIFYYWMSASYDSFVHVVRTIRLDNLDGVVIAEDAWVDVLIGNNSVHFGLGFLNQSFKILEIQITIGNHSVRFESVKTELFKIFET